MALRVREVSTVDLDSLWHLIERASVGLTSLKIDQEQLADRIERSHFAFRRKMERPEGAPYVFVLEDTNTGELVGTSCIFSRTGGYEPFYGYRIVTERHQCEVLNQSREVSSLHLVKIHNGPTELGGLFLLPELRGMGGGKLLSLARFVYMAAHPRRFVEETIAEMRGSLDEDEESPFWNAIGKHFFGVPFPRADALSSIDKQFIEELMPKYPIYIDLLPIEAREVIGRVHAQTEPALKLLESQGFKRRDLVDIFDAGPIIHCRTQEIRVVAQTQCLPIHQVGDFESEQGGQLGLVASEKPRFVCIQASYLKSEGGVFLTREDADLLECKKGDLVWVV